MFDARVLPVALADRVLVGRVLGDHRWQLFRDQPADPVFVRPADGAELIVE